MKDEERGIYRKYKIERTDGSSRPGGKHEHCAYFVLDLEHDEYAIPALLAYAEACREDHPQLSADLLAICKCAPPNCMCREATCPHMPWFTPNDKASRLMGASKDGRPR